MGREPLQRRRPISSSNGESEGTRFGKGEGKYNGVGAVIEEAAHIIIEWGIRRYTFWEEEKVSITAREPFQRRRPISSRNGESEGT
jgi:hypothetical protein